MLEARLVSKDSKLRLSDCNEAFQRLITGAFSAIAGMSSDEKVEAKQHIVKELMSLAMSSDNTENNLSDLEEAQRFAAFTINEIENKAKVMDEKPSTVKFSPDMLRCAIALYGRSKTGYKEQRKPSPMVLPSPSILNKILRQT